MSLRLSLVILVGLTGMGCSRNGGEPRPPAARPTGPVVEPSRAAEATASFRCSVSVDELPKTAVGARGVARVSLRATNGYHVNQEAPLEVTVASDDLDLPRSRFGVAEASLLAQDEVRMEIPFSARTPGRKSMSVHARFGVCSDSKCAECRQLRRMSTLID